jgi:hypothetical protein
MREGSHVFLGSAARIRQLRIGVLWERKGDATRRFGDCARKEPAMPLGTPSGWGLDRVGYRSIDRGGVGRRKTIREAEEFVRSTDLAAIESADDGLGDHLASARASEKVQEGTTQDQQE